MKTPHINTAHLYRLLLLCCAVPVLLPVSGCTGKAREAAADSYFAETLEEENARMHKQYVSGDISRIDSCIAWFSAGEVTQYRRVMLGEAWYLRGASNDYLNRFAEAVNDLKEAERCLAGQSDSLAQHILGRVYYKLGSCLESGQLYDEALSYYRMALPLLCDNGTDSLFAACALRDIGRNKPDDEGRLDTLAMATIFARGTGDTLLMLDADEYRMLYDPACPVDSLLRLSKHILFTFGRRDEAATIVSYYLTHAEYDSVARYISFLDEPDATQRLWNARNRPYFLSRYLRAIGRADVAFDLLLPLYDAMFSNHSNAWGADMLSIIQQHDLSTQRSRAEKAEREVKAHIRGITALIVIVMLATTVILLLWRIYVRHGREERLQREKEWMEQREKAELLRQQFIAQMNVSLQFMKARMMFTRMYNQRVSHGTDDEVAAWLGRNGTTILLGTGEGMQQFVEEMNRVCNGVFTSLARDYPLLTPADIQFLTLTLLDADDEDMAILLDQKKASIYQRRTRVKNHIAKDIRNLREWMVDYFGSHI